MLAGETLGARLARVGTLDPSATASIIVQTAQALGAAHTAGLVHRDLKPSNVFLCREEGREIVKLLDFGVVKRAGAGLDGVADGPTISGAFIGSPPYMSPEQARGSRAVDHRSDLWALGVLAFRCLTGKVPFNGDTLGDLLVRIIAGPIPTPSRIACVTAGFDAWWARAASRDPDGRFQSAKELADALLPALGLSSALAPDPPPSTVPFLLVSRKAVQRSGGFQARPPWSALPPAPPVSAGKPVLGPGA